jgi:hypothetical protein
MVSHLVCYPLGLIALVSLCLLLYGLGPSESAAARPMPPKPPPPRYQPSQKPKPLPGLPRTPCGAAGAQAIAAPRLPPSPPLPPTSPWTRGRRRQGDTAPHGGPDPDCHEGGGGWARARPTVSPVAAPGDRSLAAPGAGMFLGRMARHGMGSGGHPLCSYGRLVLWLQGWGSVRAPTTFVCRTPPYACRGHRPNVPMVVAQPGGGSPSRQRWRPG